MSNHTYLSPHCRRAVCHAAMLLLALSFSATAAPLILSNPSPIPINDSTNPPTLASPYPSTISVTGVVGRVIAKVTVQLNGITHSFPDDIDMMLIGPRGQQAMILSNIGGDIRSPVTNVSLTLDDDAAASLPFEPPLISGTFKPTKRLPALTFDFPAPVPPGSATVPAPLSVFNGTDPNGTWSLYIIDDAFQDSGIMAGGWGLSFTFEPVLLAIDVSDSSVVLSWTNSVQGFSLQATPDLAQAWTNVLTTPVLNSGRFSVTEPKYGSPRWYRLKK